MAFRVFVVTLLLGVAVSSSGCDVLGLLFGCDYENDPECEDPERGQIYGQITVPTAGAAAASSSAGERPARRTMSPAIERARDAVRARFQAAAASSSSSPSAPPAKRYPMPSSSSVNQLVEKERKSELNWRRGEVVVRAHDQIDVRRDKEGFARELARFLDDGTAVRVRLCNTSTMCLAELDDERGQPLDELATLEAALQLRRFHEVLRYAEPNLVLTTLRTPNDQLYPIQWHYGAMRLPAAWDITVGDDAVVAAVVDTGILLDHPELAGRVVGGADLIDDAEVAQDGNGRDNDGDDAGDNACGTGCHSHHGSHVAGTMAAETDNATMVAGISWLGSLLAVRVLGQGGGSLFDIAGGILWSVGEDVDGVARNERPADVLNMSLGGPGDSDALAEAIDTAVGTGAIVVVAAGNDNVDAEEFTPANVPSAITVASLGNTGGDRELPQRASYSNYGDAVDVAAPGGEQAEDVDLDGNPDGVLSTVGDNVTFYQGTSMAAPHVAGLAMLMKAINPDVTQSEAVGLMQETADTNITCSEGCGDGLVNAVRVLRAMQGDDASPLVVATPAVTRIGREDKDAELVLENMGGAATDVTITIGGPDRDRVTLSANSGSLAPNERLAVHIELDRTGTDHGEATVTAAYGEAAAEAQLIWTDEAINVANTVFVGAVGLAGDEIFVEREVVASAIDGYRFKLFNVTPGDYLIVGLSDDDNDGQLEDHEGIGVYPRLEEVEIVTVEAGSELEGVDFLVAPAFVYDEEEGGTGDGAVGAGCSDSYDCQGGLYCEPVFEGGYCTLDCSGGPSLCPEGSQCFCLGDDGAGGCQYSICLQLCVDDGDCRTGEGYVCDVDSTCYPG